MTKAKDALDTLGTILTEDEGRDAVHVAVVSVEAGTKLAVGTHATIRDGKAYSAAPGEGVGIVDAFLPDAVPKGARFWLMLYPRTITGLRHLWSHPAFPAEVAQPAPDKATSEAWLRDFINRSDCPGYDTVMAAAQGLFSGGGDYYESGGSLDGHYMHFNGRDAHGEIPPEFWDHAEIVLGKKLPTRPAYFSCGC